MALIDQIPTTDATVPTALRSQRNGQLPDDWLRSLPGETRTDFKMFVPVSYAMQAMHIAAAADGIDMMTTGRYRSYARQEALFRERYAPGDDDGCGSKIWQGQRWYLQRSDKGGCYAMAATPGTSNHGLGIADDVAEQLDADTSAESLSLRMLGWLADNARSFGFSLDTRKEPWHWHWYMPANPDTLTQRVVDTLGRAGVKIPDLSRWGFTVPGAAPTVPTTPTVPTVPLDGKAHKMIVIRYGGSPTGGWAGLYSFDGGVTSRAVSGWLHWLGVLQCGAIDAKTRKPITDPEGDDVTWVATEAEAHRYIDPF